MRTVYNISKILFCKRLYLVGLWLLTFPDIGLAQKSQPDSIVAHFSETEIVLDGVLNEPIWKEATPISNLRNGS